MEPDETSDTTFASSTTAIGRSLLNSPVMRSWPPALEEARTILASQPYEVMERIGHGGMGAVFKVRNLEPGMGRFEAVKIRRPEARDDDLFRERFLREIGTLAQLRHSGITTVFRSGDSAEGYLWFSMEFLEGRSLAELLAPGLTPLSPERVLDITRQLCITLKFIHQAGRLHRDLKPANVMVCDDGSVRLLDFGIAQSSEPSPINLLTRPGDNPHTPDYASPEQKTGGPVDERTDLYGLGRIVTDMIGPTHGGTREHQPRFPQRLLDLADDLLAYDRNDRPNSAADVIEKLGQLEPGSPGFWGKDRCPFRGLEAYQPEHAEIFFGRDAAIRRGREILLSSPEAPWNGFLLITGASGSGKSSLARAGLGPALLSGNSVPNNKIAGLTPILCDLSTIRPENDCLLAPLARLLASSGSNADPAAITTALRDPAADLGCSLGLPPHNISATGICLVLDQFEHFFRMDLPRSAQARFLTAIARLARTPGIAVLVTLRSDFYHQCADHPALMELKDGRQLDVAPPQPWELAAMLRLSARAAGLTFETGPDGRGLDDVLLEHARLNPQALPLLSYVLEQLWVRRDVHPNTLRLADYQALGGFEGAVGIQAKDTVARFAEDFPTEAADALDGLLNLVIEAGGYGNAFVRRRASPAELSAAPAAVRQLAERLVTARLLAQDSTGLTLAHEALLSPRVISQWESLNWWLENRAHDLRVRALVALRCNDWLADARSADLLLPDGSLLANGVALLRAEPSLFGPEPREFLATSQARTAAAIRRRAHLRHRVVLSLAGLTLTAVVMAGLIWRKRGQIQQVNRQLSAVELSAERLVNFLLYDLAEQLKPLDHPELLAAVSEQAEVYFDNQPAQKTEAMRGEVLMRGLRGNVMENAGDLTSARRYYEKCLEAAQRLAAREPTDDGARRYPSIIMGRLALVAAKEHRYQHAVTLAKDGIQSAKEANNHSALPALYTQLSWYLLNTTAFDKARMAADAGLEIDPLNLQLAAVLAHSHLFLDQYREAAAIYLKHKDETVTANRNWQGFIADNFWQLRSEGREHPDMKKIERLLGIEDSGPLDNR